MDRVHGAEYRSVRGRCYRENTALGGFDHGVSVGFISTE